MLAMLAYLVLLACFWVLIVAAFGALRDGVKARGRFRGVVVSLLAMLFGLLGIVLLLV